MTTADPPSTLHFFVDEAGDPTLFDAKGRILIGQEGCSKNFIVGKLDVDDPAALQRAGATASRPDGRPVLQACAFDAARARQDGARLSCQRRCGRGAARGVRGADGPEPALLRRGATQIRAARLRAPAQRARAQLSLPRRRAVRHAGGRTVPALPPAADQLEICFAKRGNKSRTQAFRSAIERAEARFESQYGVRRSAEVAIVASTPFETAGLQAVDYCLWALQRHYERDESRYIELVWDKVVEIEDMDRIEGGRKGVVYNKKRPLITDQGASEEKGWEV